MNFKTALGRLRLVAILEGISYLLLGITMPLKYLYAMPTPNYIVGMVHGILFIAYVFLVIQNAVLRKWTFGFTLIALLASLVPLGTFYLDYRWLRKMD